VETTAWGAASLAGLAVGVYSDTEELRREWQIDRSFAPQMSIEEREKLLVGWHRAVERTLEWAK
jgi:glycerol kinase